jgi:hypothetical protein
VAETPPAGQPPSPEPPPEPAAGASLPASGWRAGCGLALLAIGWLVVATSGLCTLIGGISMEGSSGPELRLSGGEGLLVALIYGGPVILIGLLLAWIGHTLRRRRN